MHMYQVPLLLSWRRIIKINLANLDQILDIVRYLISCSDLLRKLALVDHPLASEKRKNEDIALYS